MSTNMIVLLITLGIVFGIPALIFLFFWAWTRIEDWYREHPSLKKRVKKLESEAARHKYEKEIQALLDLWEESGLEGTLVSSGCWGSGFYFKEQETDDYAPYYSGYEIKAIIRYFEES